MEILNKHKKIHIKINTYTMANRIISKKRIKNSKTQTRTEILNKIDSEHIIEHNQTFHASLRDGVRCWNDVCTDEGGLTVQGWVFGEEDDVKDIRIRLTESAKHLKIKVKRITRNDVEEFYNPIGSLGKIGYEITYATVDSAAITAGQTIYLECNTKKDKNYTVFDTVDVLPSISINDVSPGMVIIDNFYTDPMAIRKLALKQDFNESGYHKGKRTAFKFTVPGTIEKIESLLGKKIIDWDQQPHNTVFQSCIPSDPLVYHYDNQAYAAMVFLTPDAPPECGTSFYRHRKETWLDRELEVGKNNVKDEEHKQELEHDLIGSQHNDFLDSTKWELTDNVANKFNRFVMFDSKQIHAASKYFGNSLETGRLFHMMFFNIEK